MKLVWSGQAKDELDDLPVCKAEQIESEVEVMFGDAVPGTAVESFRAGGLLTVGLPCGAEAEFERTGDGVRILYVAF